MGSVKRFEFDALPQQGGWDHIYLNAFRAPALGMMVKGMILCLPRFILGLKKNLQ